MTKETTYKKIELLRAMKRILSEYKRNIHEANASSCPLCKLYNRDNDIKHKGHECRLCPMHIFHKPDPTGWGFYSCMSRRCKPVDCDDYTKDINELKAVIKLYEDAIATVQKMTSKELNAPKAFYFLIKIDKLVAKEFCVC
jgi:hypothetical protein